MWAASVGGLSPARALSHPNRVLHWTGGADSGRRCNSVAALCSTSVSSRNTNTNTTSEPRDTHCLVHCSSRAPGTSYLSRSLELSLVRRPTTQAPCRPFFNTAFSGQPQRFSNLATPQLGLPQVAQWCWHPARWSCSELCRTWLWGCQPDVRRVARNSEAPAGIPRLLQSAVSNTPSPVAVTLSPGGPRKPRRTKDNRATPFSGLDRPLPHSHFAFDSPTSPPPPTMEALRAVFTKPDPQAQVCGMMTAFCFCVLFV